MGNFVLLVDDNVNFVRKLAQYIKMHNEYIDLIQIATNGKKALEIMSKRLPDVLILDLNMPQINGNDIIHKIAKTNIKVIIISGRSDLLNEINIFEFKLIKTIYIKPFDFQRLNEDLEYFLKEEKIKKIEEHVENELLEFCFNKGSKGYKYLVDCLKYCCQQPELLENMENHLFMKVAKGNQVQNVKIIKWSIRKTITAMERYTNKKIILKYFPHTENPTPKVFISTIINIIKIKYKNEF